MANCSKCQKSRPFIELSPWVTMGGDLLCPECAVQKREGLVKATSGIPVLTGPPDCSYEFIDSIFAVDSSTGFFYNSPQPQQAFDGVKNQLRLQCFAIGGDAVIWCRFEYRNALGDGLIGKNPVIELFAYGTAVRLKRV